MDGTLFFTCKPLNLPAPLLHQKMLHRRQLSFWTFWLTVGLFEEERQRQHGDAAVVELVASDLETSFSRSSCYAGWAAVDRIDAAALVASGA